MSTEAKQVDVRPWAWLWAGCVAALVAATAWWSSIVEANEHARMVAEGMNVLSGANGGRMDYATDDVQSYAGPIVAIVVLVIVVLLSVWAYRRRLTGAVK